MYDLAREMSSRQRSSSARDDGDGRETSDMTLTVSTVPLRDTAARPAESSPYLHSALERSSLNLDPLHTGDDIPRADSLMTQNDDDDYSLHVLAVNNEDEDSHPGMMESFQDEIGGSSIAMGELLPDNKPHRMWHRPCASLMRNPCFLTCLWIGCFLVGGGIGAGIALAVSNSNKVTSHASNSDGLAYSGATCVAQDEYSLACAVGEWPGPGYVLVFTECPRYNVSSLSCPTCPSSLLTCKSCAIYEAESVSTLNLDNDRKCNTCTICEAGVSLNCANLSGGSCAITDCDKKCIGPE